MLMSVVDPEIGVLHELVPVVEANLNRHLSVAKPWQPHNYVPWSEGRNFAFLGGNEWDPGQSKLDPVARTAMEVNLLTEDNLPSYHREIAALFGRDGAWGQWVGQWTAEEGRHSIALRDYLMVTRGVDPVKLEQARMEHMVRGHDAPDLTLLSGIAYVTFQELATRISHRNTGKAAGDPIAEQLMARIAQDENLHMVFYRNLVAAALEIDPNATMQAITQQVMGFSMPGEGLPGFTVKSARIAMAGIYDPRLHLDDVVTPPLKFWKIFDRTDLHGAGEAARVELANFLEVAEGEASAFVENRDRLRARQAARAAITNT